MPTNTGGKCFCFWALARNMAPMTYHDDSTLRFLNEMAPLCSLYSLIQARMKIVGEAPGTKRIQDGV